MTLRNPRFGLRNRDSILNTLLNLISRVNRGGSTLSQGDPKGIIAINNPYSGTKLYLHSNSLIYMS